MDAPSAHTHSIPSAGLAAASLAIARRFVAGATMWCLSPQWPHHARHVAVEFVHPVMVGKRALPAIDVPGADPVAALRVLTRPGDVLVAVGDADATVVADAVRRCAAWGVTSVWIGAGAGPAAGAADHVLWLPGETDAAWTGRLVLLYHLLWELTHVCFEHPGLIEVPPEADACITCSDQGIMGEVVEAGGRVRMPGGVGEVDLSLVGPVASGDLVLVHAGTAIGRVP